MTLLLDYDAMKRYKPRLSDVTISDGYFLQENRRPLILVGHSFGGILIKKALVIAKGKYSKQHWTERLTENLIVYRI